MGLIGNEGMLGATLVLGIDSAPQRAVVQGSGTALRMTAVQLRRQMHNSPSRRAKALPLCDVRAVVPNGGVCALSRG